MKKLTMTLLRRIASELPKRWQYELKRIHFGRQIIKGTFETLEPEYKILSQFIASGDWVIDIGANVGHYTKRLSELVGACGRVIAFEPVPTTFAILNANVQLFAYNNVTLINAAVLDKFDLVGMSIPKFSTGCNNYYQAHLSPISESTLSVLCVSLDSLNINQRVALVKIDVEGQESCVLAGMKKLLEKYHPVLIIETDSKEIIFKLKSFGYMAERLYNSPNVLLKPYVSSSIG